jgi:NAD(P)-dependent dehydrogenase (short-subunit alcohol dehydrogenase family)
MTTSQFDRTPTSRRTALITGASRGLGQMLAHFLAGQGYHLILTARGAADLADTAEALRPIAAGIDWLPGDVADSAHRRRLAEAVRQLGRLDVLINNASTLGLTPLPPLAVYPQEAFEQVLEVNLLAPLALVQETLPLLRAAQGVVVNISSDAAIGGYPGWGAYGASKAALDLVSKTLAAELAAAGVSVVSVDPGDMRTAMHQAAYPGEDISDRPLPDETLPFWAWLLAQTPSTVSGRRFQAQAEVWTTEEV